MNTIQYENGCLRLPGTGLIDLNSLGWDPARDITIRSGIPCYSGNIRLPVDVLVRNGNEEILAVLLCGLPLEDMSVLRSVADVYGDSAKAVSGRRPAVYFLTDGKCVAFRGLLGQPDMSPTLLPKSMLQTLTVSENLQEETFFSHLLQNPPLLEEFLTGKLDSSVMNDVISKTLDAANAAGLEAYYEETASPDPEGRKLLRRQAVLQVGAGAETASAFIRSQLEALQGVLLPRLRPVLKKAVITGTLTEDDRPELDQALSFLGWDRQRDVRRFFSVPCCYDESLSLLSDYAFLSSDGSPLALVLMDTLHLSREKQDLLGTFYARSCRKKYGIAPFLILCDKTRFLLRSGDFCGGFQQTQELMSAERLAAEVATINIVEKKAWEELVRHEDELLAVSDLQDRSRRQLDLVRSSSERTQKALRDRDRFRKEASALRGRTDLPEEEFLEKMMGETVCAQTKKEALTLLRNFNVEKQMCLS